MLVNYYENIDYFLGNRNGRYFGDGYLGAIQSISDFEIYNRDGVEFNCLGKVQLKNLWSKKGEESQTPHLSTIDVIELSLECLHQYLLPSYDAKCQFLVTDHLIELSIVAGNSPVEDSLDHIKMFGKIFPDEGEYDIMEVCIANMTVQMTFAHFSKKIARSIIQSRCPVYLNEFFFDHKNLTQSYGIIDHKDFNKDESWSISSAFACTLQLGQLLLYKLDNIDRSNSNTLWMKRTKIKIFDSIPHAGSLQPIRSRLNNVRKYTKSDGDWRRADIIANLCNMEIECSVTHKLPVAEIHKIS